MPLIASMTPKALKANIKAEIEAGKPPKQAVAIGYAVKREAEKKGGVDKMSEKTKARRKSFCARMCGHKKKNTSSKTANDPKSKINAALRVWKCRC